MFSTTGFQISRAVLMRQFSSEGCYAPSNVHNLVRKKKIPHPYRKVHPWRSIKEFTKSLVAGVIHNEDGLVAINKPYGISGSRQPVKSSDSEKLYPTGIVKEVKYTVAEVLPEIARELGYDNLQIVNSPERFTSGVAILAANDNVAAAVEKAFRRAQGMSILAKTYWAVTTRVPNEIKGEKRLAMKMKQSPTGNYRVPMIITKWSENERERSDVKILNVQFQIISNSVDNLSSLIEIKSSTKQWHALRLFASTVLYSPILGDNIYGSRVQYIMGKWMNISPFVEAAQILPRLNKDLLKILRLSSGSESMIPAHLHLREIYLPMYGRKSRNLVLIAPPMPEFVWTAKRLKFKHALFETDENDTDEENHPDEMRMYAAT